MTICSNPKLVHRTLAEKPAYYLNILNLVIFGGEVIFLRDFCFHVASALPNRWVDQLCAMP